MLTVSPHPLLDLAAFTTDWPAPLGSLERPAWLTACLTDVPGELPPLDTKTSVRDLLRHGGFKPNGRNKPCSEYIVAAAAKDRFPWINVAVDATNLAVLHGGLPVSTVDPTRLQSPFTARICDPDSAYVFNQGGQTLKLDGLLALHDANGPCSNSVKDAQHAKTTDDSVRTLTLIWGTTDLPGRTEAVTRWHRALNERLGGRVEEVSVADG